MQGKAQDKNRKKQQSRRREIRKGKHLLAQPERRILRSSFFYTSIFVHAGRVHENPLKEKGRMNCNLKPKITEGSLNLWGERVRKGETGHSRSDSP